MRRIALLISLAVLAPSFVAAGELPDGAFAQLGGSAFRHPDRPSALAYRPDGKHLASGGPDGCVRIWDTATGAEVAVLKVKDGHANALAYSADGTRLVAHYSDEKVRLYDATDAYKALRTVAVANLDSLSVSSDAKLIAAASTGGKLLVVETATGLDRMEIPDGKAIALSPNGGAVAASDAANAVTVYEVPGGKPLAKFDHPKEDKGSVTAIAYSADGKRLAVASEGAASKIRLYDIAKKELLLTIDGGAPLAFCGADRLALRQAGKLALYDLGTSKRLQVMGGDFTALAVTPDGQRAATDGSGTATARIRIWDLKEGVERLVEGDTVVGLRGIVATPTPEKYWVIDRTGISAWAVGKPPALLSGQNPPVAFARSDLAFTITDGKRMWKVPMSDKDVALTQDLDLYPEGVRLLAVSADDTLVAAATAGEKPRLLIGSDDLHKLTATVALPSTPLGLAVHPEKKSVAAIGRDGLVRVWEANSTTKELWKARVARSLKAQVAYSPDGKLLAVTSVVRVTLFDAKTGEVVANFERQWDDGPYSCVAFSPDSRLLIAGTQGTLGTLVIWEIATGTAAKRFIGNRGTIAHLGISPDCKTLSTVAADDNALLWDFSGRRGQPAPTEKQLKTAWMLLARSDAEIAWPAIWTLRAGGNASLALIGTGIADASVAVKRIDALVADLGSKDFAARETASKELAGIGAPALPAIKLIEEKSSNAEARERAGKLIAQFAAAGEKLPDTGLVGEPLRLLRAVSVLETIPGVGAKERLDEIRKFGGIAGAAAEKSLKARK